jgi:hypothetical protein
MLDFPTPLLTFLRKAGRVAVLTGAGVSQESGLRTFRDAGVRCAQQRRGRRRGESRTNAAHREGGFLFARKIRGSVACAGKEGVARSIVENT